MRPAHRLAPLAAAAALALAMTPVISGPAAATSVANDAQFRAAWANGAETLITLTADVAIDCVAGSLIRNSATGIVVDGAGFELSNPCALHALTQNNPTGQVTLRNLTLSGSATSGRGLDAAGPVVVEESTVSGHGNDGIQSGESVVLTASTVSGNGADGVDVVDAAGSATVIGSTISDNVARGVASLFEVSIEGSTITNNAQDGVRAEASVTVSGVSEVTGNGSLGSNGYGIFARGDVTVSGTTSISGNGASGIFAEGSAVGTNGDVTVTGTSTISDNGEVQAVCEDGITARGDVTVSGTSTINGNVTWGINASGTVSVSGATVMGNGTDDECTPGGILSQEGSVAASNSIVSENGGSGIYADGGDATVTDSVVSDNEFSGIYARVNAEISRSTVSGNGDTGTDSSGIVVGVDAAVTDSTITGNAYIGVEAYREATVTNSTITDNGEVGVFGSEEVHATNATITGNRVNIANAVDTTIHLFGTVVAQAVTVNCIGTVEDLGYNFVDDASCLGILPDTADPQLGDLGDNGGPTRTRLPASTSPLVNAIPSADCEVAADQRGVARPQGAGCDIGSVEVAAATGGSPTEAPTVAPSPGASQLPDTRTRGAMSPEVGLGAALTMLVCVGSGLAIARRHGRARPQRAG